MRKWCPLRVSAVDTRLSFHYRMRVISYTLLSYKWTVIVLTKAVWILQKQYYRKRFLCYIGRNGSKMPPSFSCPSTIPAQGIRVASTNNLWSLIAVTFYHLWMSQTLDFWLGALLNLVLWTKWKKEWFSECCLPWP